MNRHRPRAALEANLDLKLTSEGHSDSTGDADHNLDLPGRRTEAVRRFW
jgi:outer membrane protein OmpA-like peptidoglycan-associated protein